MVLIKGNFEKREDSQRNEIIFTPNSINCKILVKCVHKLEYELCLNMSQWEYGSGLIEAGEFPISGVF